MTSETRAVATLSASEILAGLNTVRSVLAPDLTPEELRLFAMVANRSGLDPFAKQVYAVKRKGRVTFQTGIDGYRSIAARTGLYDGQDEPEYGPMVAGHPESATVRVYRKGVSRAIAATAFWDEYVPDAGPSGNGDIMWRKMPRVMIAKVAEALALRKAFPYDPENRMGIGADIYTADEMAQATRPDPPAVVQQSARDRVAQRAAAIVAPPPDPEPEPEPEPEEIVGEAIEVPATPAESLAKTPQEAAADVAVKRAARVEAEAPITEHDGTPTVSAGLSVEAFRELCVQAGKMTQALSNAIECVPADVKKRVEAMSPVERGVLADELGIEWRNG